MKKTTYLVQGRTSGEWVTIYEYTARYAAEEVVRKLDGYRSNFVGIHINKEWQDQVNSAIAYRLLASTTDLKVIIEPTSQRVEED